MHLTETALNKISVKTKLLLALALNLSEASIYRHMNDNKENGPLTTFTALRIIEDGTGLTQDQILTESKAKATA